MTNPVLFPERGLIFSYVTKVVPLLEPRVCVCQMTSFFTRITVSTKPKITFENKGTSGVCCTPESGQVLVFISLRRHISCIE